MWLLEVFRTSKAFSQRKRADSNKRSVWPVPVVFPVVLQEGEQVPGLECALASEGPGRVLYAGSRCAGDSGVSSTTASWTAWAPVTAFLGDSLARADREETSAGSPPDPGHC